MEQITKALFSWATILEEGTRQQAMTNRTNAPAIGTSSTR